MKKGVYNRMESNTIKNFLMSVDDSQQIANENDT